MPKLDHTSVPDLDALPDSAMLTIGQVCQLLQVSKPFVREQIDAGRLRAKRMSERVVRVSAGEMRRLLAEC